MEADWKPFFEALDMADPEYVVSRIAAAVEQKKGFSVIRYGDGEGILSGYPDYFTQEDFQKALKLWWGDRAPEAPGMLEPLRAELEVAVRDADILGVPRPDGSVRFRKALQTLHARDLVHSGQVVTWASLHRSLNESESFRALITGLDFLGLVTCRDVKERINTIFAPRQLSVHMIPEEAAYARQTLAERHYPDRFEALRAEIRVPYPGAVYLIGAGVCGKVYAHWIKQQGGVAVDLGSVFDVWAGRQTRAYIKSEYGDEVNDDSHARLRKLRKKASAFDERGETAAALSVYDQILALAPYQARAYHERSLLQEKVGDMQGALESARKAVDLRPGNPDFRAQLERLLNRSGVRNSAV